MQGQQKKNGERKVMKEDKCGPESSALDIQPFTIHYG